MDELAAEEQDRAPGLRLGAIRRRALAGFVTRFLLLFAVFMLPIAGIGRVYAQAFCNVANPLLPSSLEGERFALHLATSEDPEQPSLIKPWEAVLRVEDRVAHRKISVLVETKSLAYVPVAVFVALALATPIKERKRELQILIGGFLLTCLLVGILLIAPVLLMLSGGTEVRVFQLDSVTRGVLELTHRALLSPPGMAYALPALIWWACVAATRPRPKLDQPGLSS